MTNNSMSNANGQSEICQSEKVPLTFFVNGKKIIDNNPDPECTLLTYLREKLRLCGTKLGCGEGGCGACTVMVSKINRKTNVIKHMAVNACITPICSVHGSAVTTVEGIGSTKTRLHPVQERIAKSHGSQCGFCTPGIVMSMYALLRSTPTPSMKDLEITFQGNLCRCTGYRPIIEGYRTFTKEYTCEMGENCCRNKQVINGNVVNGTTDDDDGNGEKSHKLFNPNKFSKYNPTQEPIFPPELKLYDVLDRKSIKFYSDRVTWYRPINLNELLEIKQQHPNAKIVVGNTEVGVEVKFKKMYYPIIINPVEINEMTTIEVCSDGVKFGTSVTLDDINETLTKLIDTLPEHETRLYLSIVKMLHYFAGKQIRNVSSVGGNIMTGSPISDLIPIFTAAEVQLEVQSLAKGKRYIHMGNKFFTGYRKTILEPDEVLTSLFIPKTNKNQYSISYKQAKRRDDDIAIVNLALIVHFKNNTDIIQKMEFAFGGMAPTVVMTPKTSSQCIGHKWNNELVELVNRELISELPLSPNAPGGMIQYRRSLTLSLFFKAYLKISKLLENDFPQRQPLPDNERSGSRVFHTQIPKSTQFFEYNPNDNESEASNKYVGVPKVHISALKQVTGEAIYCDDLPKFENELYLAFVLSTKAYAKILSINTIDALQMTGVHAIFTAKDLTDEQNMVGPVVHDEQVFKSDVVTSQGQVIAAVIADNQTLAQRAAAMVKIEYQDLSPIIITIEDAIKNDSFYPIAPKILKGDVDKALAEQADHVIEGECRLGGQEHFYLETHATIAVPRDTDELEVHSSTQHPSEIQKLIAHTTGLPAAKITVKSKRIGGGFGGKESRGIIVALPVAFAAYKLQRPIRCMLDRDEDMMMTGTRHPFYFKYKVGCTAGGKIVGCDIQIYNNAGYSRDLSQAVLERAMFHFENSYLIPNVRVCGKLCKTNLSSNTAFRGFGGPQGMFAAEHMIRDIARVTGKDVIEIIELNLYKDGDTTHYNQQIENCTLTRCWTECLKKSDYHKRKLEINQFNKLHRWRKRGISIVPTKFGIAFTFLVLNQTGALVHIYTDGSVLITHGGVEMGQGLHTKMIQVAAQILQIPIDRIHIAETATDKVPNTSATAASAGSDLNGMAVMNACNTLMDRLKPYREAMPNEGWNEWIKSAYFDRVSLSTTGFYATPNIGYDMETNTGIPFNYFTFGVGCSEVEIDCLTGDHQVIRTDIVMDLGSSINPAIDIGQIEGAFMQGYGLFTLEELIYSPTGQLYSKGPGMYKLPGFTDIPIELNVSLLKGAPNPRAVFSSKAVGEPPLFLASSIFFAIKDAIGVARKEEHLDQHFKLLSPATAARIRMACQDKITKQFIEPEEGSYTPWNIVP